MFHDDADDWMEADGADSAVQDNPSIHRDADFPLGNELIRQTVYERVRNPERITDLVRLKRALRSEYRIQHFRFHALRMALMHFRRRKSSHAQKKQDDYDNDRRFHDDILSK